MPFQVQVHFESSIAELIYRNNLQRNLKHMFTFFQKNLNQNNCNNDDILDDILKTFGYMKLNE